jgi:hypothetical protein
MRLNAKITVVINESALANKANKALDAYAKELDVILDRQFTDEKWNWPRTTRRRNGTIAQTSRDIIDTGALRDSKIGPLKGPGNAYGGERRWIWNIHYAEAVKNGTGSGHVPRDWVTAALDELPLRAYIARYLKR